jgi:hypothetical protein
MYMQQEKNLQKQQELNDLEQLIVSRPTIENAESERLKELAFKYPYQTFQLFQKHAIIDGQPKPVPLMKAYIVGFSLTHAYSWKLKHYLVKPPQEEKDKKEFDRIIEVLEDMILRQSRDN